VIGIAHVRRWNNAQPQAKRVRVSECYMTRNTSGAEWDLCGARARQNSN
jgi:hypothetical protein